MHSRARALSKCVLILAVIASASGCTSARRGVQRLAARHLADTATSYNLAIEQTQDEMLLLNVVRAQDNYPLYITDASKVTGTVKADINLGLKIPLVHAGRANDYFAMPSVDYSSSPSMDVNLFNTKDFMTGFLAPIPTEMFAYYWDQGWPSEFLLYLVVLRVDVYRETGDPNSPLAFVESLHNHPDSRDRSQRELQGFAEWVHGLVSEGRPLLCSDDAEGTAVGPPLETEGLDALKFLVPVAKEGLVLSPTHTGVVAAPAATAGTWQLRQPKKAFSLAPQNPTHTCPKKIQQPETGSMSSPTGQNGAQRTAPTAPASFTARGAIGSGKVYMLTLRSPEGILYYLGQLTRLENRATETRALLIHVCDFKSGCADSEGGEPPVAPLFVALDRQEHSACPFIIWVRSLDGSDYMIPRAKGDPKKIPGTGDFLQLADASHLCATGRSMQALDLLSQLIGLQKSAKDFTTTSTVKVVGQ